MEIISLGTGTSQGIPLIGCHCKTCESKDSRDKRLRSSIYVRTKQTKILVDVGPDVRQQFLSNQLESVDHVLITHEHNDHVIGMDDLRAINFIQKKNIPVYAEEGVAQSIKQRFAYAFGANRYPGAPQIELRPLSLEPFEIGDILVTPLRIQHGKLAILGFKFNDFAYITDASHIANEVIDQIRNVDTLIINALHHKQHTSHFSLSESLAFIEKINPRKAFLTHISHRMGPASEWYKLLPKNVRALEDKLIISMAQ